MAWIPISRTVPQYSDPNGSPYSGAVLKAYASGTTTVISLATSAAGTTTATSIALNASGFPEVSGSVVIPHVDQDYKLALYPTQAAADADSGAIWTVDALEVGTVTTEWVDSGLTPAYVSSTSFTLDGDQTGEFHVGRRLRLTDSGGTDYASITASAYTSLTTVTVSVDGGGSLDAGLSAVDLSILSADNSAIPHMQSDADGLNVTGTLEVGGAAVATTVTTTRGDLIARGASADGRLALGTTGQVLTSDGTDPAWTDPHGWVKIGTTTFSGTAEYELALSASYREYRLVIEELLPATNDQGLVATVSDGSYKSSGYMYSVMRQTSTTVDAAASGSAASILLTFTGGLGNVNGEEAFGEITIKGHQNSGGQCHIISHIVGHDGSTPEQYWAQGRYLTDAAITTIKLAMESGNFASGKITAYGLLS